MEENTKRPVILAILDGWGFSQKTGGNPIKQANKPALDEINRHYPMVLLQASGLAVGMAWGESGNSEVGHLNIGAGRIVEQYYSRINRSIADKTFLSNPALAGAFKHAAKNNSRIHLIGLLTSGTVHAAYSHIIGLLEMAVQNSQTEVYLHLFLDGRDSGPQEGVSLLSKLNINIQKHGYGKIITIIGRDFAMDRDNKWDKTQKAFNTIVKAEGEKSDNLITSINNYYQQGINDSAMPPIIDTTSGYSGLKDNDALIFFNFREDSMRQIIRSFIEPDFNLFPRADIVNLYLATMTQYLDPSAAGLLPIVAFFPPDIKNGLAEYLSISGKAQMHIAETDKYAHVTYFFNGLQNNPYQGENDIFMDSVENIEQNPQMGTPKIMAKIIEILDQNLYDFIIINFANADLLAHTGNYNAVIKGIEAIDTALGSIQAKVLEKNGILIITADHGNAESMINWNSGETETKHNDSPVFCYLIAKEYENPKSDEKIAEEIASINGILSDVAPTILELMGLPRPPEMDSQSLLSLLSIS